LATLSISPRNDWKSERVSERSTALCMFRMTGSYAWIYGESAAS
jgi:hypothetical protein